MSNSINRNHALSLIYDGPALKSGRMPAKDVGLAIAAAGKLVELSNKYVSGGEDDLQLEVNSYFRHGSFEISFSIAPWINVQIGLFADPIWLKTISSVFGPLGLIWLIKSFKGKLPNININVANNEIALIKGGKRVTVDQSVQKLLMDREAIEASRTLVDPLKRDGIESLRSNPHDGQPVKLFKEDVPYFDVNPPKPEKLEHEHVSNPILMIDSIMYNQGHKWHFSAGDSSYRAKITDSAFWNRVAKGQPLPMGTALNVEMVTKTTVQGDEIHTEHTITKVHQIIPGLVTKQEELSLGV